MDYISKKEDVWVTTRTEIAERLFDLLFMYYPNRFRLAQDLSMEGMNIVVDTVNQGRYLCYKSIEPVKMKVLPKI